MQTRFSKQAKERSATRPLALPALIHITNVPKKKTLQYLYNIYGRISNDVYDVAHAKHMDFSFFTWKAPVTDKFHIEARP